MGTLQANHPADSATTVILSTAAGGWGTQFRSLWQHRELLYFLAWRDIKVRYKQTVVGIVWVVIQPLAIALTLTLFLGRLVQASTGGLPYPVFAYAGMVVWQFFSNAFTETSNSLLTNERLIGKVYFPRLAAPIAAVLASLLDLAVSLAVLAVFLAYYRIPPTGALITLPLMVLLAATTALGAGLWLAALNVKYRDVRYVIGFLVQFWFFVTPVVYPAASVPIRWQGWYALNPMAGVVEGFRWSLHGGAAPPWGMLAISTGVAAALLISGLDYFWRTEDTFADFI